MWSTTHYSEGAQNGSNPQAGEALPTPLLPSRTSRASTRTYRLRQHDRANRAGAASDHESMRCCPLELGIDGFRFDLAIALSRGEKHAALDQPPVRRDRSRSRSSADLSWE